jgi:hypothetical protein
MKMSSGATVFEISDIQEDEAEAVSFAKTPQEPNVPPCNKLHSLHFKMCL